MLPVAVDAMGGDHAPDAIVARQARLSPDIWTKSHQFAGIHLRTYRGSCNRRGHLERSQFSSPRPETRRARHHPIALTGEFHLFEANLVNINISVPITKKATQNSGGLPAIIDSLR